PHACARWLARPLLVLGLLNGIPGGAGVGAWAAAQVEIAPELSRLAAAHGFSVSGLEVLEDERGRAEEAGLYRRLRVLLERFDHILVHDAEGEVARVIIIGRTNRQPPAPQVRIDPPAGASAGEPAGEGAGRIEVETIRKGSQHSVRVTLEGERGRRVDRALLIDTGADTVVLPDSMIAALGLDRRRLETREVQTANGRAQALIGRLEGVWLDGERLSGVAVAFLERDKLGAAGLLGMSVLGRYQMTIDDERNRLLLTPNRGGPSAEGATRSE
ncbi:MAG: retropepsin-like aspartic protease family protein, partial [Halochromatium sp.]